MYFKNGTHFLFFQIKLFKMRNHFILHCIYLREIKTNKCVKKNEWKKGVKLFGLDERE